MKKIVLIMLFASALIAQNKGDDWRENRNLFDVQTSKHFILYSLKEKYDKSKVDEFLTERETGYLKLQDFFELDKELKVNLYIFPDQGVKYKLTQHRGLGWGTEKEIVEVFNDSVKLDPYHELIHIFNYKFGAPNALIDEGLAVYLSDELGGKFFQKMLGYENKSLVEVYKILIKRNPEFNYNKLFELKDISESKNVPLAYISSALITKQLVKKYGKDKLLEYIRNCKGEEINYFETFKKVYDFSFESFSSDCLKQYR